MGRFSKVAEKTFKELQVEAGVLLKSFDPESPELVDENNYINGVIFKLNKKDSTNFIFYKQDKSKTFSESDFALVESTECQ